MNTDGTGYTVLKTFSTNSYSYPFSMNADGANPSANLTIADGVLYGTLASGSVNGSGSIFKVNTDGTGFTPAQDFFRQVLKIFSASLPNYFGSYTNSDGANPKGSLTLSGGVLYGTTSGGGILGWGTLFKINTNGTGFTVIKRFADPSEGEQPQGNLTLSGGSLYGTTYWGLTNGYGGGRIFKVNLDGTGYTVLKSFSADFDTLAPYPSPNLLLSGNILYGTTLIGGTNDAGTVFKVNTDGTGYIVLKNFSNGYGRDSEYLSAFHINDDGACPGALILANGTLYGTTTYGGSFGLGTIFALGELPFITAQPPGRTNLVGASAVFNVTSTGALPLSYQWQKNSTNLANAGNVYGADTDSLILSNLTLADAGNFSVTISNSLGVASSSNISLTVVQLPTLQEALDAPNLTWNTGGNQAWSPEVAITHDGVDAAQSGAIPDSQFCWVETSVTGPGTLAFWWKVSSQTNSGFLTFATNGIFASAISGETGWQQNTFTIGTGSQTLRWTYSKDETTAVGQDAGWLDQVSYTPFTLPAPISVKIQSSGGNLILNWTNPAFTLQAAPNVTGVYTNIPGATSPYTNPMTGSQQYFRLKF